MFGAPRIDPSRLEPDYEREQGRATRREPASVMR
jgi:hypothetical protein